EGEYVDDDELEGFIERRAAPPRETVGRLVRRPIVQLLLVVTAAAQVVNVRTFGVGDDEEQSSFRLAPTTASVQLAPATVTPDTALQRAWLEKAVAREAARLGSEYRIQGYDVSPQLAQMIGETAAEFQIDTDI